MSLPEKLECKLLMIDADGDGQMEGHMDGWTGVTLYALSIIL